MEASTQDPPIQRGAGIVERVTQAVAGRPHGRHVLAQAGGALTWELVNGGTATSLRTEWRGTAPEVTEVTAVDERELKLRVEAEQLDGLLAGAHELALVPALVAGRLTITGETALALAWVPVLATLSDVYRESVAPQPAPGSHDGLRPYRVPATVGAHPQYSRPLYAHLADQAFLAAAILAGLPREPRRAQVQGLAAAAGAASFGQGLTRLMLALAEISTHRTP